MVAASHGASVGVNYTLNWSPYTSGFSTSGFNVTGKAFGVDVSNWFNSAGLPYSTAVSNTLTAGGLTVISTAANAWGSGIGNLTTTGPGVVLPGDNEVTWSYLDDTSPGYALVVSGLTSSFPNGYVIQTIGVPYSPPAPNVNITDSVSFTNSLAYTDLGNGTALSAQSALLTNGSIRIVGAARNGTHRSTLAGFIVTDRPVISKSPRGGGVNAGATLSLSASAIGIAPLSYQWQHAGTNLPGATNPTYVKTNASALDGGDYRLVSTNSYGAGTSAVATVTVTLRPTMLTDVPARVTNYLTMSAALIVVTAGAVPLNYQWSHAGTNLPGATSSVLALTNLQEADAGSYQVIVTNSFGAATSSVAALSIISSLPPSDGFSYPAGSLWGANGGVGWGGAWTRSATGYNGSNAVLSSGAAYRDSTKQLVTGGGAVLLAAEGTADYESIRQFQTSLGGSAAGTLYLSFIGQITNTGWGGVELALDGTSQLLLGANWNANNWGWGDRANVDPQSGHSSTPCTTKAFVVYRFDATPTNVLVRLYVNPALAAEPATPSLSGTWGTFQFNQARIVAHGQSLTGTGPNGFVDELRVGGTWAAVTPNVLAMTVAWTNPASIAYGMALTAAQLNATANVPGAFTYSPPFGTVLNARTNTLTVVFTPVDTNNYTAVTTNTTLVVSPTPLTVTAMNVMRPYGQTNPVFRGTMSGLTNSDNITANYSCSATAGSPAGTYPIVPSLADPNNRLTNYQVTLVNGTLSILNPPAISGQPQSVVTNIGASVSFSVAATGTAPLYYQWTRNGTPIGGATNLTYRLNNVQLADSGSQFSCVVSNAAASIVSAVAALNVAKWSVVDSSDGGTGSLRQVIGGANAGDSILVTARGTIVLTNGELLVNKSLSIYGLGASNLTLNGKSASRIFNVTTGATLVLQNMGIANGLATNGGAIYNAGQLAVIGCVLSNNAALQALYDNPGTTNASGGAIYNRGTALVNNCWFTANLAAFDFTGFYCTNAKAARGGALYNAAGGYLEAVNCTFSANFAAGPDGGGTSAALPGDPGGDGLGGAAFNEGILVLKNCTATRNGAYGGYGGYAFGGGVGGAGGNAFGAAFFNAGGGRLLMTNCTMAANCVIGGVGGFSLTTNGPGASGLVAGGLYGATGSTNLLVNSILAFTYALSNADTNVSMTTSLVGPVVDAGHNLCSDPSAALPNASLVGVDPLLRALADNGGPTPTMLPLFASPARDAGDANASLSFDQRGLPRPSGVSVDIGAVEWTAIADGPLQIVQQPGSMVTNVGNTVAFSLVVSGQSPVFQWRFNGTNLADNSQISGSLGSLLVLTNVQPFNAGAYDVVITNSFGSVTSVVATLAVSQAPNITNQPADQPNVSPGSTVPFRVGADGSPTLCYQWFRSHGVAQLIVGATNNQLNLSNVTVAMAGGYYVIVTNSFGSVTSRLAALAVTQPASLSLRFYAAPPQVYHGDTVQFFYVDRDTNGYALPGAVLRENILSWSWDFNNDGVVDAAGNSPSGIDAQWQALYDPFQATSWNKFFYALPVLRVTYTNTLTGYVESTNQYGITEPVGITQTVVSNLVVMPRGPEFNPNIQANFSVNPRLIVSGGTNRFYASINLLQTGRVDRVDWWFGEPGIGFVTNLGYTPSHSYSLPTNVSSQTYDVAMRVAYSLLVGTGYVAQAEVVRTNPAMVWVTTNLAELSLGRAYRRGFPHQYDWDDITLAYSGSGFDAQGNPDDYTYYHHFETAFWQLAGQGVVTDGDRRQMAETVNEIVQGQSLVGNKRLIEALRLKYPRLTSDDQASGQEVLPVPPGVLEQTAAIDVALLDYEAALAYPFIAIQNYGLGILRSRAPAGNEPYPSFPGYLTFVDPSLSQQPIPIKNEYWQLSAMLEKMTLGSMAKAQKLFNLSVSDATARTDAKEECKKAGIAGYLGMAVLAAGQSQQDFAANQGNAILANIKNARDLFNQINAGLNPLGNDGSFIPNESFAAIYQDAQSAVADARQAQVEAREEKRTFDRYQADLRNELQSQRAQFITPLVNLTGLDPEQYNNLQTVDDQNDYKMTINQRVNALMASYPNADPAGLGEYGAQVIAILDAGYGIQQAINRLNNLYEGIKISRWANAEIDLISQDATEQLQVNDIARGYANAFSFSWGSATGFLGFSGITFNPGSIVSGYLAADDRDIQRIQQARIADTQLEEQIRKSLLEVANLSIDIRRAKNQYDQQKLKLDSMLSLMDRYIADLAHARDTAANLYFQDPSFRVVVSRSERRAEAQMDFAVDRLWRLAKTLEYEWTEPYQNPIVVPINCAEAQSLENPLFDKFTQIDDLFIASTADEAKDYLSALQAWDSKLRRINVISVRGPNHAGPITAEPVSVREQVLGLAVTGTNTLESSIYDFRNWITQHRVTNSWNAANPSFSFEFSTGIADNSYFPATGSRWNMRIASISIDLYADQGFSTKQVAEIDLTETGMTTLRRFWAEPPLADDLFNLTFNLGRADRSAFGVVVPAKINGATGGRPTSEFINVGLADRPIAATKWILTIDTSNPSNAKIDFSKLKDIIIRFTYTYGNPPEFPNF
jgi:hypothetical protein